MNGNGISRRPTVRELARDRGRPRAVEPWAEPASEAFRGPHPADRFLPLRDDHAKVEVDLEELRGGVFPERERIARWTAIATALETHAQAEEERVYPHLAPIGRNEELLSDHAELRRLIGRIDAEQGDGDAFRELLDALASAIRRHVELEEGLVLPLAEQRLEAGKVDRIVASFIRRERQIQPGVEARRRGPGSSGDGRGGDRARRR